MRGMGEWHLKERGQSTAGIRDGQSCGIREDECSPVMARQNALARVCDMRRDESSQHAVPTETHIPSPRLAQPLTMPQERPNHTYGTALLPIHIRPDTIGHHPPYIGTFPRPPRSTLPHMLRAFGQTKEAASSRHSLVSPCRSCVLPRSRLRHAARPCSSHTPGPTTQK